MKNRNFGTRWLDQAGLGALPYIVLTAALLVALRPVVNELITRARLYRATHDVEAIGIAIITMQRDLSDRGFLAIPRAGTGRVMILVGDGAIPGATTGRPDLVPWTWPIGYPRVDLLSNHLILNTPFGRREAGYPLPPSGTSAGAGRGFWRGAYLQGDVPADPWGHRYAVNVQSLGTSSDTIVLSAGPDGVVQTSFRPVSGQPRGDDVAFVVAPGQGGTVGTPAPAGTPAAPQPSRPSEPGQRLYFRDQREYRHQHPSPARREP